MGLSQIKYSLGIFSFARVIFRKFENKKEKFISKISRIHANIQKVFSFGKIGFPEIGHFRVCLLLQI